MFIKILLLVIFPKKFSAFADGGYMLRIEYSEKYSGSPVSRGQSSVLKIIITFLTPVLPKRLFQLIFTYKFAALPASSPAVYLIFSLFLYDPFNKLESIF